MTLKEWIHRGTRILWNLSTCLPNHTVWHTRRTWMEHQLP